MTKRASTVGRPSAGNRHARFSPYELALGSAFGSLDAGVRRAHLAPLVARGTLDVQHGSHRLTPLLVALMKLPAAGHGQPVRLEVAACGAGLEWTRRIGSTVLRTRQRAEGTLVVEEMGLGRIVFALEASDGALVYRQVSMRVGAVALPAFVSPRVDARVSPAAGDWRVEVAVTWRGHLVCRYAGLMGRA